MDFTDYIDLAAERLGGRVLAANDEFFAPKDIPTWANGWTGGKRVGVERPATTGAS